MEQTISNAISEFLNLMAQAQKDFVWSQEEVHRQDQLTQDYLHMLELGDCSYHKKARIAEAMGECRAERRAHKDNVAILTPLITFLESEKGKMTLSQLQQTLGAVRKAERAIQDRRYVPRVLSQEEYDRTP